MKKTVNRPEQVIGTVSTPLAEGSLPSRLRPEEAVRSFVNAAAQFATWAGTSTPVTALNALAKIGRESPMDPAAFMVIYSTLAAHQESKSATGTKARLAALSTQPWSAAVVGEWRALRREVSTGSLTAIDFCRALARTPGVPAPTIMRALLGTEDELNETSRAKTATPKGKILAELLTDISERLLEPEFRSRWNSACERYVLDIGPAVAQDALRRLRKESAVNLQGNLLRLGFGRGETLNTGIQKARLLLRAGYSPSHRALYERIAPPLDRFVAEYEKGNVGSKNEAESALIALLTTRGLPDRGALLSALRVAARVGWSDRIEAAWGEASTPALATCVRALVNSFSGAQRVRDHETLARHIESDNDLTATTKFWLLVYVADSSTIPTPASEAMQRFFPSVEPESVSRFPRFKVLANLYHSLFDGLTARPGSEPDPRMPLALAFLAHSPEEDASPIAKALPWIPETERFWRKRFEVLASPGFLSQGTVDYAIQLANDLAKVDGVPPTAFSELLSVVNRVIPDHYQWTIALSSILQARPWHPAYRPVWNYTAREATERDTALAAKLELNSIPPANRPSVFEPRSFERITRVLGSLCRTNRDRKGLEALVGYSPNGADDGVSTFGNALLTVDGAGFRAEVYRGILGATKELASSETGPTPLSSEGYTPWPTPALRSPPILVPKALTKSSMAILGDGPAALMMANMRKELGYSPSATTVIGARGAFGGIWNNRFVLDEGHNTFRPFTAFERSISAAEPRPGSDIERFIAQLADGEISQQLTKGQAKKIEWDPKKYQYRIEYSHEGVTSHVHADSVYIATGNRIPRSLAYGPMQTNASTPRGVAVRRWQRQIPEAEYPRYENAIMLCVGLGNSTMAMLGECRKMLAAGVNVRPLILTHRSMKAVKNPDRFVEPRPGVVEGPIYRDRFDLSRIAGDIPRIRERYEQALENKWILPDVVRWDIEEKKSGDKGSRSQVTAVTRAGKRVDVPNIAEIYALVGYQNDPVAMQDFGCVVDPVTGIVDADPLTGRVRTRFENDSGRIYIGGAAASRPGHRNQEVIPGMGSTIPLTTFTEIVAAFGDLSLRTVKP